VKAISRELPKPVAQEGYPYSWSKVVALSTVSKRQDFKYWSDWVSITNMDTSIVIHANFDRKAAAADGYYIAAKAKIEIPIQTNVVNLIAASGTPNALVHVLSREGRRFKFDE
jgi:hypothetical protein